MADTAISASQSPLHRYGAAVAAWVLALALVVSIDPLLARTLFIVFWPAVFVAAWIGGRGPGVLTTVLSALAVDYFFVPPVGFAIPHTLDELLMLVVFVVFALAAVELTARFRATRRRAIAAERDAAIRALALEQQGDELSRSLAASARNDHLLRETQAIARIGSWSWDIASGALLWSDVLREMFGIPPGAPTPTYDEYVTMIHPDDRAWARSVVDASLQSGEPFSYRHRIVWPDGSVHWLQAHGRIERDADGHVTGMLGSSQDITAATLAEAALRESEARFRRLFVENPLPMWVFDLETLCFLDVNEAAVRQYGFSRAEFLAMTLRDIRMADEVVRLEQTIGESDGPHLALRGVFAHRRKDGSVLDVEITTQRATHEGRAARLVLALDVTEREGLLRAERRARELAEQANRAKMDFLATMSHELRTPLNAIGGYAELIEMEIHGPVTSAQQDALARIQRSQRHLLGLINDVLNFAKLTAGRIEYQLADVMARAVVDGIEPLVATQFAAKSLRFDRSGCNDGCVVRADPEKLEQILLNLLSNAVKFTPAGGEIAVSCGSSAPDAIAIAVRDSGVGIATGQLSQIFEPFVQVDRRLTSQHEGTGLGLAISRDLARAMGGDITVESTVGAGSCFTIVLPAGTGGPAR